MEKRKIFIIILVFLVFVSILLIIDACRRNSNKRKNIKFIAKEETATRIENINESKNDQDDKHHINNDNIIDVEVAIEPNIQDKFEQIYKDRIEKEKQKTKREKHARKELEKKLEENSANSRRNDEFKVSAPVLRCYDTYIFPNEGQFHVKTCSAPKENQPLSGQFTSTTSKKFGHVGNGNSTNGTNGNGNSHTNKIFLQWFPVEKADHYKIYAAKGNVVTVDEYDKEWTIPSKNYSFESEHLEGNSCWSMIVTAVGHDGIESETSKTYTTCQKQQQQ